MQETKGVKILDWKIKPDEDREAFIYRIYSNKELIGDNELLAEICRRELNETYDESAYRKKYQSFAKIFDSVKEQFIGGDASKEIDEKMDLLYKQQIKTRDSLREKRKTLRDEARIEVLIDAIKENAKNSPQLNPIYTNILINKEDGAEAILTIGDWHTGDCFSNFKNEFNEDILIKRVEKLLEKTVKYCEMNNVTKLNVVNLGDMIAGLIHGSIRIESELRMVEQVKRASELIYQLLVSLSEKIKEVTYRSCLDNHSRMTKEYSEHIEKESFALFIEWWLEAKLCKTRVQIIKDNLDENIGLFKLNNEKNVFFVHGHLDQVNTVTQNLTFGSNVIADIVLMGHWHVDKMKTFQSKKVYINGTLKGMDSYALNKRYFGEATQMLLIFNDSETIDIRINL